VKLPKYLSVPEAAKLAGMSKEKMRRRIAAIHSDVPGGVLVKIPGLVHPQVDVAKLLAACPDPFGKSVVTIEEYEKLMRDIEDIKKSIRSIFDLLRTPRNAANRGA
jgi:hypothetical protein